MFNEMFISRGPMWMLVNTTIFSDLAEVGGMVDVMIEQLNQFITEKCGATARTPRPPTDELNCEWDEYEQNKKYLTIVDDIIQECRLNIFLAILKSLFTEQPVQSQRHRGRGEECQG